MATTVLVGAQWGDEGKGKVIDVLTEQTDIVVRFQGGNNAGTINNTLTAYTTAIPLNTWTHVCGGFDSSAGHGLIFINGAFGGSGNWGALGVTAGTNFNIGRWPGTPAGSFWLGKLDDIRIYNTNLGGGAVAAAYDPRTRWDLYYELGRKSFFLPPVSGTAKIIGGGSGGAGSGALAHVIGG